MVDFVFFEDVGGYVFFFDFVCFVFVFVVCFCVVFIVVYGIDNVI